MKGRAAARAGAANLGVGLSGSLAAHAAMILLLVLIAREPRPTAPVYAVDLVAAPLPSPAQKVAPEALPSPPPEPAEAVPDKTPVPDADAVPIKAKPKPVAKPAAPKTPSDPKREPAPKVANPAPAPVSAPSTGTDATTIKTPGLEFPFPEYLRNIMNQVYRRWGVPNTALRAEVSFTIMKDGTVRNIGFAKRSGNFAFDLDAQGAIEAAGNARAFGPLPDGWPAEVLNVVFVFEPRKQ